MLQRIADGLYHKRLKGTVLVFDRSFYLFQQCIGKFDVLTSRFRLDGNAKRFHVCTPLKKTLHWYQYTLLWDSHEQSAGIIEYMMQKSQYYMVGAP